MRSGGPMRRAYESPHAPLYARGIVPDQLLASAVDRRGGVVAHLFLRAYRGLTSVPLDTEDGRALLQTRLAQFARVSVALSLTFLLISVPVTSRLPFGKFAVLAHVVATAVNFSMWIATRGPPRRTAALIAIDCFGTWADCGVFLGFGLLLPIWLRPELVQILCCVEILAVRAVIVPSAPRRTWLIGSVPLALAVWHAYSLYARTKLHPDAYPASTMAMIATVFALSALIVTTLISHTIFGLRERVRQAVQLGQYTLLEKIGEGGMGIVYRASHALLRRPTAIKLLPPDRAGEHNLRRFEREVQLTSLLTHPNTIAIYDYGRSAGGVLYYAMEYLEGVDLESLVALAGPQEPGRVVHLLSQVCGALEEAHRVGLIHRDIKPGNILACVRGGACDVAKVVDFGLVKELAGEPSVSSSALGQIVGTPLYMSPEAISRPGSLDATSDLYALAAVGYFLLTGEPPFVGRTVLEVCGHHLHTPVEPPSARLGRALPRELEQVLMRCLAKEPAQRLASAAELGASLRACRDVTPWNEELARAWWDAYGPAIAAHKGRAADPVARASTLELGTIAVDLHARGAPG